jgi:hypothetical protein
LQHLGFGPDGPGEAFIQEANDYGYPVMPFHEYRLAPGLRRSPREVLPAALPGAGAAVQARAAPA